MLPKLALQRKTPKSAFHSFEVCRIERVQLPSVESAKNSLSTRTLLEMKKIKCNIYKKALLSHVSFDLETFTEVVLVRHFFL